MCTDLIIENSYTHEIVMKTGISKYALSNLQNLPGRDIESIVFLNKADYSNGISGLTKSPNGLDLISIQSISGCYLTLIGKDGQRAILDKYPASMLLFNQYMKKIHMIKSQQFSFDKSYIQIDLSLVEDGRAIVMVIYFKDLPKC